MPATIPNAVIESMISAVDDGRVNDLKRLVQDHPDWADHDREQDDPLLTVLNGYDRPEHHAMAILLARTLLDPMTSRAAGLGVGSTDPSSLQEDESNAGYHRSCALSVAAWRGMGKLVALLLPFSNPNTRTMGPTPLRLAVNEGHLAVLRRLAPHVDPNVADRDGTTPLMAAAGGKKTEVLPFLLTLPGIDLDRTDRLGSTALMHAVRAMRFDQAEQLVRAGANPNLQDSAAGFTALMMAVANEAHGLIDAWLRHDRRADLPEDRRLNLLLRNGQGQTVDVLAEALGCPHRDVLRQRRIQQEARLLHALIDPPSSPSPSSATDPGTSRPRSSARPRL